MNLIKCEDCNKILRIQLKRNKRITVFCDGCLYQ